MRRDRANLLASYLGNASTALAAVVFVPAYLHYLGIEAYGLIGFFAALQAWLVVADLGLAAAVTRDIARMTTGDVSQRDAASTLHSVGWVYMGLAVLIAGGGWMVAPVVASNWLNPVALDAAIVQDSIRWMAAIVGVRLLATLAGGVLSGLQRLVALHITRAGFSISRGVLVIPFLAFIAPDVRLFFAIQFVLTCAEAVALLVLALESFPGAKRLERPSFAALRRVARFSAGLVGITLLSMLLTQIDKVMLSRMLPLDAFGDYALAVTIAGVIGMLATPIGTLAQVRFTQFVARKETGALTEAFHGVSQGIAVLVVPAVAILWAAPSPLLYGWTGETTIAERLAPTLSLLAIGTGLNTLLFVPYQLQLAHGRTRFAIVSNIIAVLFLLPAILVAVPKYGAMGAAGCWLLLNAGYVLIGMPWLLSRLLRGEYLEWILRTVIAPAATAGLIAVAGSMLLADWPENSRVENLASAAAVWLVMVAAVLWVSPIPRRVAFAAFVSLKR